MGEYLPFLINDAAWGAQLRGSYKRLVSYFPPTSSKLLTPAFIGPR